MGYEVKLADLLASRQYLNGVPKVIGTPFVFLESVRGLIRFGVEANGVAGDICSADDANHLTFVHNRSFLKMMLGKRCAYGSHVVLQVNSKDVLVAIVPTFMPIRALAFSSNPCSFESMV